MCKDDLLSVFPSSSFPFVLLHNIALFWAGWETLHTGLWNNELMIHRNIISTFCSCSQGNKCSSYLSYLPSEESNRNVFGFSSGIMKNNLARSSYSYSALHPTPFFWPSTVVIKQSFQRYTHVGSCWVQAVIETSVSAVLLDWHVPPGAADFLQVDFHKHQTWLLPSTVTQHLTPGVHCQGVAIWGTLLMVAADLRCC